MTRNKDVIEYRNKDGLCGELSEKGRDQVTPVLFVDVSEIKICHRGLAGIAHHFHIFNDCRTEE